jgi:hypothetical protein
MRSMTPAAVLALLALLFAWTGWSQTEPEAPPAAEPGKTARLVFTTWSDRHRGLSLRYPSSWSLRPSRSHCLRLSSPDGVEIALAESRRSGQLVAAEHGRTIYADRRLEAETTEASLAAADAVLESVRLTRSGRCGFPRETIRWRQSRALGSPGWGRLVNGVKLPAEGRHFFTWDPVLRRSPNRSWRRWGTDGLVRVTLRVIDEFAAAHPLAPRVGVGDLSRPRGGDFGPKHETHTNGLDVDVYYPRKDARERPPRYASQVDRRLAQELVDLFVAAGATRIYVGPNVGLTGPRWIIRVIPNHDNHLHARIPHWRA